MYLIAYLSPSPMNSIEQKTSNFLALAYGYRQRTEGIRRMGNQRLTARAMMIVLVGTVASSACLGDTMLVGMKKHSGTFAGYENNEFVFTAKGGRMLRQGRMQVRSVLIDTPREVILLESGKKAAEVKLVGYAKSRFTIIRGGQEQSVIAMRVKRITVKQEPEIAGTGSAAGSTAARTLDIAPLEARKDLSPQQSSVLNEYKVARDEYHSFLSESSSMVARMDGLTGAAREQLLNTLRTMKNGEQPLKRRLESAETALLATIPQPWKMPTNPESEKDRTHAEPNLPDVSEDEVLLIDVSGLEKILDLNEDQKTALEDYNTAKNEYDRLTAGAVGTDATDIHEEAIAVIKTAQKELLKAFPGIKFE